MSNTHADNGIPYPVTYAHDGNRYYVHAWKPMPARAPKSARLSEWVWTQQAPLGSFKTEEEVLAAHPHARAQSEWERRPNHRWGYLTSDQEMVYGLREAPEIDWRPNETIPEDFYAMSRRISFRIRLSRTGTNMPHDPIAVAKSYVEKYGPRLGLTPLDGSPSTLPLDKEFSKRAGAAFDALKHEPNNPDVRRAYEALAKETLLQFKHMVDNGMKIEAWRKPGQPYANSKEMREDVQKNAHLWYFPTDVGFGGDDRFNDHPLYAEVPGTDLRYNDLFRAVHDYYAHATHGHQFGPQGEQRAWHEHSKMFSRLAKKALTTETHGQNSWVNFGPHEPWKLGVLDRPYADQKAALLPEEFWPKVDDAHARPAHES